MNRILLSFLLSFSVASHAAVVTFEDINPAPASYDVMPSPYSGFTFTNWFFGPDTIYTPASGVNDLFTDYYQGDPNAYVITDANGVSRASSFYFDGAWFSGFSGVQFELYLGGNLVATSGSLPDAAAGPYGPTWLSSGYAGLVDTVRVSGVQGYFAMDDFTYRLPDDGGTVPVSSTLSLLAIGLLGLGMRSRSSPGRRHG